ncbi:MAG: hypothetical protein P0S96_00030 [Simkaniaceae bacterium]|nr:hypothetical protein [Candidatus Sacchlamyda saccharinae]
MGIQLMLIAGLCIAISNLCLRRSIDAGGTSKAYLMLQLGLSVAVMVLLGPVRTGDFAWDTSMALFAVGGGVLLAGFMGFLGKSFEHGPPGLSVAMLNCSTVMPILMLVLFFGSQFGFYYTLWNAVGSLLVIFGICWAGWDGGQTENRRKWLLFISLTFFTHVAYLIFLHWRALFINFPSAPGLGFSFSAEAASMQWFMPIIFLTAASIQGVIFFTSEKRVPSKTEFSYGFFGSIANGLGAYLMVKATEVATTLEHAMLFPIFSVTLILGCNIWGKFLYQEQVNWKANAACIGGILLGTIEWSSLFN